MAVAIAPQVGVVIANHNNEAFVVDAIEFVARQTIRDLQVVVVDDASSDGSDGVIQAALTRLDDPRFSYVRLRDCLGQAGAIRRGLDDLSELDAPFVCFLDSDDYWYDEFLNHHLAVHLNSDFPVALTYCDSHIVNAAGKLLAGTAWWFDYDAKSESTRPLGPSLIPKINTQTGVTAYADVRDAVLHTNWSPDWSSNSMSSMMLRRNFVDLVLTPPLEDLRLYVDFYLSTFAAILTGAIAIPSALYAYRMHGKNMHSNGTVLGGPYNPSKKKWEPIRDGVLRRVIGKLQHDLELLRQSFGDYRCEQAAVQLRAFIRSGTTERGTKSRNRLQELIWGQ